MPADPTRFTVAIDPGGTTGVAIFQGDKLITTLSTKPPHGELLALLATCPDSSQLVVERGPAQGRRQPLMCEAVEEMVREAHRLKGVDLHWVRPSEWKPNPVSKLLADDPKPATKHEKDAARMGRFWLARKQGATSGQDDPQGREASDS